jgi:shikimate dehydrogenase
MALMAQSPNREKFLTGLIGAPIAASAAPAMHEQAAAALGVRCHYQLIEVAGADTATLRSLLDGVRRLGFAGVNVTFPYKEAVIPLLDELSARARDIGAVNTVVVRDGRLIGHNTDTTGFERAIADLGVVADRGAVALIGAGGVGKAIAFALATLGVAELSIFDADHAKAEALATQLHGRLQARVADDATSAMQGVTGVVNGTPVGMLPDRGMAVPEALLHRDVWVADAVYTPLWTPLLTAARAKGAKVMTGRELAIYQAADAFDAVIASRYGAA